MAPAKVTTPTRVLRASKLWSTRWAAATSAARIESPASVLGKTPSMRSSPTTPFSLTSVPEDARVESEVSSTRITSKRRSSPSNASARPATKAPCSSVTTLPSAG